MGPFSVFTVFVGVISCFGAVDKTSSSFSAHGKIAISSSSSSSSSRRTVVVVVDVVDFRPVVDAHDLDDGPMIGRSQVEREGGTGVTAGCPGRRRRTRRDVRHVERAGKRFDGPLGRRHRDAKQREYAV